jgi:hypothetical protein
VAQVARPLRFDFCTREAFPFAGIALHEVSVNDDRANTNLRTDDLCGFERTDERRGNDEVDRANALGRMECLLPAKVGESGVGLALPSTNGIPFRLAMADEKEASHGVTVPDLRDRGVAFTA